MCKWCMKHGAGGKWYMNAKLYSDELAKELNLKEYLEEQWLNFENVFIRKVMGLSSVGLGYKLKIPIIGRVIRWNLERMIHGEFFHNNPIRADGHFGQVVPLEDAQIIFSELAAKPIIQNYCMCRMMQRGVKDVCCFNFGVLSEVIEKLPRFIPKNTKVRLERDEAIAALETQNKKGRMAIVTFQPVPYINAICSCELKPCGMVRLRRDFGLKTLYKAEYIIDIDPDKCQGCKKCVSICPFNAIWYTPTLKRVLVDQTKCYGCGVCRHECEHDALKLIPRPPHLGY
ncbi:MAG: ATP-binding protein [Candidatus Hodarchaeota archaeon]